MVAASRDQKVPRSQEVFISYSRKDEKHLLVGCVSNFRSRCD